MSFEDELPELVNQLKDHGVEFDAGLSDVEVNNIEQTCNFQFPPDLRTFLQLGVPLRWKVYDFLVDENFPNWREDSLLIMHSAEEHVVGTFHSDIENNNFWMKEWGNRPKELNQALAICDHFLQKAPILIPLFGYRFLPGEPNLSGNPVFSMWQPLETIYYGYNIQNYLMNEFVLDDGEWGESPDYRYIPLWSDIVIDIGQ
jgi:hypothetical protein